MKDYINIKNYIHNELGITKEYISQLVLETIQKEVEKLFVDDDKLRKIIENIVKKAN